MEATRHACSAPNGLIGGLGKQIERKLDSPNYYVRDGVVHQYEDESNAAASHNLVEEFMLLANKMVPLIPFVSLALTELSELGGGAACICVPGPCCGARTAPSAREAPQIILRVSRQLCSYVQSDILCRQCKLNGYHAEDIDTLTQILVSYN